MKRRSIPKDKRSGTKPEKSRYAAKLDRRYESSAMGQAMLIALRRREEASR